MPLKRLALMLGKQLTEEAARQLSKTRTFQNAARKAHEVMEDLKRPETRDMLLKDLERKMSSSNASASAHARNNNNDGKYTAAFRAAWTELKTSFAADMKHDMDALLGKKNDSAAAAAPPSNSNNSTQQQQDSSSSRKR